MDNKYSPDKMSSMALIYTLNSATFFEWWTDNQLGILFYNKIKHQITNHAMYIHVYNNITKCMYIM